MHRLILTALTVLVVTVFHGWRAEAAEDHVSTILMQFAQERAEAAQHFTPAELATADRLAKRAEEALAEDNPTAAARLARDARWVLPFRPVGLPNHVTRVIGTARLRHADRINDIAYSPDGRYLASASRDGTVRVWNLGNGREITVYRGHAEDLRSQTEDTNVFRVPAVAFAPDGQSIASSGGEVIHIWEPKTGKPLHTLKGHKGVAKALAFGSDANTLLSGGDDRTIHIWDVKAEKPVYTTSDQNQRVEAVAFGAGGQLIAAINAAGELSVYNPATKKKLLSISVTDGGQAGYGVAFAGGGYGIVTAGGDTKPKLIAGPAPDGTGAGIGQTIRAFTGHSAKVNSLAATPNGQLVVTGSQDKSVRIWDASNGKQLWSFQGHLGQVTAVALRPDGQQAASGGEDGTIRLWPLTASDEHRALADAAAPLWTVAYSPDGSQFATAGADRTIRFYDGNTGKLLRTLTGHKAAVTALVFRDRGHLISASGDKLVKIWNLSTGTALDCIGHSTAVLAVATDASGKRVLSGSVDKSVRAWNPETGKNLWTWPTKSAVCTIAVRNDGQQAAVGTADGGLTILALSPDAAKPLGTTSAHLAGTASVVYAPDGSRLATCGGDGTIRLWNVSEAGVLTPGLKFEPPARPGTTSNPLTALAFSADGRYLLGAGADSIVHIWDIQAGAELRGLRGHTDWVTAAAFRPDGLALASVGVDKTARLFDLSRHESEATGGHTLPIRGLALNSTGTQAATASEDRTVKIWDLASGREVATLSGASDALNAVSFVNPKTIVAAGDEQRVRWWSLDPVKELRSIPSGRVFNLASRPDGQHVAAVWAKPSEKLAAFELLATDGSTPPVQITEKERELSCAAIAADASIGITGGTDGTLRIWDLQKKERLGNDWPLFSKAVADVGLTPDKKTIVAIDVDGTVHIADFASRKVQHTIAAVPDGVNALSVARTGDKFATLSVEGTVRVWSLDGKELRAWKLPTVANAAGFTPDGRTLITANRDGTLYVLALPQ
ncbi:MAG: WD40 repeat domain-containing protein [Bacteroidales bacterium]|nr:WD40 repeat domain-containing protein [Bacteroidales bacterium]